MAGIANVATLPDYRGHGFASQLLRDLHAVMDAEDFAFGLLFTGIHDFYARLGWERLPLPLYQATPAPVDLGGWRFRVAEPDDLPRLQRWYDAFYADHPLTVARDDAYWRIWTRWDDPTWRAKFYLAEDPAGVPRGYLALETYHGRDEQGNRIVEGVGLAELGADPADAEAVRMLIGFASQTAHMAGARLDIFLPEADIQRWVRPLLSEVRWVGQGSAMVRVCCWQTVYDALESLVRPRLKGWRVRDRQARSRCCSGCPTRRKQTYLPSGARATPYALPATRPSIRSEPSVARGAAPCCSACGSRCKRPPPPETAPFPPAARGRTA
jgi:hypothetical protein